MQEDWGVLEPCKNSSERRIDQSPQEISFQWQDNNANAQPNRSSEIEKHMLPPKTLLPFGLPADSSTADTILQGRVRKSNPSAEIEALCWDFGRPPATNEPVNPFQNTSALFNSHACNMGISLQCVLCSVLYANPIRKGSKIKYDYGDRWVINIISYCICFPLTLSKPTILNCWQILFANYCSLQARRWTVLPISLKQLPNGEYVHPIGHQRKGMQWDGIYSVWVPIHFRVIPRINLGVG